MLLLESISSVSSSKNNPNPTSAKHTNDFPLSPLINKQIETLKKTKISCRTLRQLFSLGSRPAGKKLTNQFLSEVDLHNFQQLFNLSEIAEKQKKLRRQIPRRRIFRHIIDAVMANSVLEPIKAMLGQVGGKQPGRHLYDKKFLGLFRRFFLSNNDSMLNNSVIKLEQVCDGSVNCAGEFDEQLCPGKFYCINKRPLFVDKHQVLNGRFDCSDGSDEAPVNNINGALSVKRNVLDNWVLQVIIWVIAIISLLGNISVIVSTVFNLAKKSPKFAFAMKSNKFIFKESLKPRLSGKTFFGSRGGEIRMCNSLLVLNLAVADLLTGTYLLWLAFVSRLFNDKLSYGDSNREWQTCNFFGAVLLTSSQTSLFTLVCLTSLRLFTVVRPFSSHRLKWQHAFMGCLFSWIVAIVLGLTPLIPSFDETFIENALVPFPQFQSPVINKTLAEQLVRGILILRNETPQPQGQLTWSHMIGSLKTVSSRHSNWRFYGFYSQENVCMPKLFVDLQDQYWGFTAALVCLDFASVLYITIAYFVIYFASVRKKPTHSSNKSSSGGIFNLSQHVAVKSKTISVQSLHKSNSFGREKQTKAIKNGNEIQRRIALLVFTDCLCWIPVCLMSLLSLSGFTIPVDAYVVAAVLLLPINSALNPLLYSRFLRLVWLKLWSLYKPRSHT